MQWRNAPEAGFNNSGHRPWLPVNPNTMQGVNVFDQEHDPNSLLNFYKRILDVRKQTPALKRGSYTPVDTDSPQCLAFLRQDLEISFQPPQVDLHPLRLVLVVIGDPDLGGGAAGAACPARHPYQGHAGPRQQGVVSVAASRHGLYWRVLGDARWPACC